MAPLALPPDLPPVILIDLDGLGGLDELLELFVDVGDGRELW